MALSESFNEDFLNLVDDADSPDGVINEDELLLSDDEGPAEPEVLETPIKPNSPRPELTKPDSPMKLEVTAPALESSETPDTSPTQLESPTKTDAPAILSMLEDDEEEEEPEETMAFKRLKATPTVEPPLQPRPPQNPQSRQAPPPFREFRDFRKFDKFRPQEPPQWPPFQPMMRPNPQNYPPHPNGPGFFNAFPGRGAPPRPRFFFQGGAREFRPMGGNMLRMGPEMVPEMPDVRFMPAEPPRRVLINPNFKGGVEAAKNQLIKEQFRVPCMSDIELERQQQEFISKNLRCVEKRRYERSPKRWSRSPTPPPLHRSRGYQRHLPPRQNKETKKENEEEDEETRNYREQIAKQKQKREDLLKQKEMRRRQAAELIPMPRLEPIVVTEKKIILKKKDGGGTETELPLDGTQTPPLQPSPARRIVLKPSPHSKQPLASSQKRKITNL